MQVGQRAGFFSRDPLYVSYYHDQSTPLSRILENDWIVLEQQQGSKFFTNLELFLSDLASF